MFLRVLITNQVSPVLMLHTKQMCENQSTAVVFTGGTDQQARYRLVPHQVPDDAGGGNPVSVLGRQ